MGLAASALVASVCPRAQAQAAASSAPATSASPPAASAPATASPKPATPSAAAPKAAPPSAADLAAAKKNYADGEKKYKAGDFEGALASFKSANDVKATPQAERYIGLCEDAIGHYAVAVDWYDKFLAHVPDKMAPAADDLKKREAEIKAMPGHVHVDSTPPGASVAVDDKPANGVTPMDLELPTGAHKLTLTAQGHLAQDKAVDVSFASTQTVAVELAAEPPPPAPPPPVAAVTPPPAPAPAPPPPPASPLPAYITGGIAIAAVAVGTGFGIAALNDKSDFDKNPTSSTADNGDTHALIADMSFGIAITFGVTSAVLFLTKDEAVAGTTSSAPSATKTASRLPAKPKAKPLPAFVPAPMVGPHLGGASFTWRF
jgi:hypothetical protein